MAKSLVDTDWVAKHGRDPDVCLVEIDWDGLNAYEAGHIPGALGWNWKAALWDPLERQFPSQEDFARRLGAAGIGNETTVVFYGVPVQFGTYAWWVFRYCGHEDVRILDGGRVRWEKDGRPLTAAFPDITPVSYLPNRRNEKMRAGRDDVLEAIDVAGTRILDHRSFEEYSGERVGVPGRPDVGAERRGRIPGARHVTFDSLLNVDETFKSPEALREILSPHVEERALDVISYCRLSHRATLASFAMTEILGYPNVRVYDGSWTEWGSMVGMPIEK